MKPKFIQQLQYSLGTSKGASGILMSTHRLWELVVF